MFIGKMMMASTALMADQGCGRETRNGTRDACAYLGGVQPDTNVTPRTSESFKNHTNHTNHGNHAFHTQKNSRRFEWARPGTALARARIVPIRSAWTARRFCQRSHASGL